MQLSRGRTFLLLAKKDAFISVLLGSTGSTTLLYCSMLQPQPQERNFYNSGGLLQKRSIAFDSHAFEITFMWFVMHSWQCAV